MSEVLVLDAKTVKQIIFLQDAIEMVEKAFTDFYLKKSSVYPAVRESVDEYKGIFGIKSSFLMNEKIIGLKAGGFWKENVSKGKTNHQSTMLLFDPTTGEPISLLDANYLTGVRTGAAGYIAAKHLARRDSKVLTLIGAGIQARTQMQGIIENFPIEEVNVFDQNYETAQQFALEIPAIRSNAVKASDLETAVSRADIVITTTPSFSPVIKTSWLKKGAHINAMGSDTKGKREVLIDVTLDKVVCDFWEQSSIMGELQHGFKKEQLYAEIGQITSGDKRGREQADEITFFDSTGIAVQDLSVAYLAYSKAKEQKLGILVNL